MRRVLIGLVVLSAAAPASASPLTMARGRQAIANYAQRDITYGVSTGYRLGRCRRLDRSAVQCLKFSWGTDDQSEWEAWDSAVARRYGPVIRVMTPGFIDDEPYREPFIAHTGTAPAH